MGGWGYGEGRAGRVRYMGKGWGGEGMAGSGRLGHTPKGKASLPPLWADPTTVKGSVGVGNRAGRTGNRAGKGWGPRAWGWWG